jgi:hypothetical protein
LRKIESLGVGVRTEKTRKGEREEKKLIKKRKRKSIN